MFQTFLVTLRHNVNYYTVENKHMSNAFNIPKQIKSYREKMDELTFAKRQNYM